MQRKKASGVNQQPTDTKTAGDIPKTPNVKTIGEMKMYFLNRRLLDLTNKPFKQSIKNALSEVCIIESLKNHISNQFDYLSVLGFLTKCCKSETKGRGVNSKVVLTEDEELVGIVCLKKEGDKIVLAINEDNKKTRYVVEDIGIGGKDLYIDLLCGIKGKGYGKIVTSYVEKLARKYGYEKIVLNSISSAIKNWQNLGFINLNSYYEVEGNILIDEGVKMEKKIINNPTIVGGQNINDIDFEEITTEVGLKNFFTKNVIAFGNPFVQKGGFGIENIGLGLGATDDLEVESETNESENEDTTESESEPEHKNLTKSVTSPVKQIVSKGNLLNDIKAGALPGLLADALSYTLFELNVPEKNEDVDFFVNLIQKDYNEPDDKRDIYDGGIYYTRQVELFKESELGNIIRDSFRDNFGVGKKELDENSNLNYFKQVNKQDSDTRQMEFFEQVMEQIKSPPNAIKEYPFITRESGQMDRTFEYIKSLFAEYRQKFSTSS